MRAKRVDDKLFVFEKESGVTGVFSHKEKDELLRYAKGGRTTAFIERLMKLGILKEGAQSEIIEAEDSKIGMELDSVHIDITDQCPLKCPQCYKGTWGNSHMSFQMFKAFIEEANDLRVFQIALGGGEPLEHPDILRFVELISNTEMAVTITTSGYGLTDRMLVNLEERGVNHIQVSLNSINRNINDKSRDGYTGAIDAIKKLGQSRIPFGVNIVIRKDNLRTLEDTAKFVKEMGGDNINILRYKPAAGEDYLSNMLNEEEFLYLADVLRRIKGIKIKVDSAYTNLLLMLNRGNGGKLGVGCMAGKGFIAISKGGIMKPCSHLKDGEKSHSIRNYYLKQKSIAEKSKYRVSSLCTTCKKGDICGGCRAIEERIKGHHDIFSCPV